MRQYVKRVRYGIVLHVYEPSNIKFTIFHQTYLYHLILYKSNFLIVSK